MGAQGTTTINFGTFPGSYDTSVAVTGQAAIVAGSLVEAWLRPEATADHTADEHMLEPLKIMAGNIIAGTGFTIYAFNETPIFQQPDGVGENQSPSPVDAAGVGVAANYLGRVGGGRGVSPLVDTNCISPLDRARQVPRLYGLFTVAWVWN